MKADCAVEDGKNKLHLKNVNTVKSMTVNELKVILNSQGKNPLKPYATKELKRRKIDLHL